MKIKKIIETLSIEVTRRCNMKCLYCARGDAQDLDISRETIDKILDEWQNGIYVYDLRIAGGEPMLASDKQIYLIDEIIKRNLPLSGIHLYTNGTILDEDLRAAYMRMGEYLEKVRPLYMDYINPIEEIWFERFPSTVGKRVHILISVDKYHENKEHIEAALEFYNAANDYCVAVDIFKDSMRGRYKPESRVLIEGKAEQNYKSIMGDRVSIDGVTRPYEKYYFFMEDPVKHGFDEDAEIVRQIISVSANGNVFPGCMVSYIHADRDDKMFNVMECNGDLMQRLKEYAWEHPMNHSQAQFYSEALTFDWLWRHRITVKEQSGKREEAWKKYHEWIKEKIELHEEAMRQLHEMYPHLTYLEVKDLASTSLYCFLTVSRFKKLDDFFGVKRLFSQFFTESPGDVYDYLVNVVGYSTESADIITDIDSYEKLKFYMASFSKINAERAAKERGQANGANGAKV